MAKRKVKTKDPLQKQIKKVERVFTFFAWNFCIRCNNEFRRERGYKYNVGPTYRPTYLYMCSCCGQNRRNACELFLPSGRDLNRKKHEQLVRDLNRKNGGRSW